MHLGAVATAAAMAVLFAGAGAPSPKAMRKQAAAAERDMEALSRKLVQAGERRSEAEARAAELSARLEGLAERQSTAQTQWRTDRDALEAAIAGISVSARTRYATQTGVQLSALTTPIAARAQAADAAMLAAQREQVAIAADKGALRLASTALDRERAVIEGLIAEKAKTRATLLADAAAAEKRAQERNRRAKTLAALADARRASARAAKSKAGQTQQAAVSVRWRRPVQGALEPVGPKTAAAAFIARPDAQVVAPVRGTVSYAGLFRTYGQVLILDGTDGYVFILTGLDRIYATVGQVVLAGEPVGDMPDAGAPKLGLEIRRNGALISAARWVKDEIKPQRGEILEQR